MRRDPFTADDVEAIRVGVDEVTPTILIYDSPASGLEGKFSMPFCAAAAIVCGGVGVETFDDRVLADRRILALQARVTVRLKNGCELTASANGARGYPAQPASDGELAAKFTSCASRVMSAAESLRALEALRAIDGAPSLRSASAVLARARVSTP
jgi:2-methylcitrate dehydratase PrpD